jgi:transcriptional regulator with GAF, ATPase, and Fis domain
VWIPALAAAELRRDLAALGEVAGPVIAAADVDRFWRTWPSPCVDAAWASADACRRIPSPLGRPLRAVIVVERCAALEAAEDARRLRAAGSAPARLADGEALEARGVLLLPLDPRVPAIGWTGSVASAEGLLARVRALASAPMPVLVRGETGTGKDVVARALHRLGTRREAPWLALNCAELAESLVESELFGHRRGAFSGALRDRAGLFAAAGAGTLFLDEIAELSPPAQAKLLRVLEDGRVRALGDDGARPVACRVVAATNRDLAGEVAAGRFRGDLFHRLRGATIELPPLRGRGEDVLELALGFAARAAIRLDRAFAGFTAECVRALEAHAWPGNVRELRQTVELAVLVAAGPWIGGGDLSVDPATDPGPPPATIPTVRELERTHLLRALDATAGNRVAAARLLGLTRQSLDRRLRRHGLIPPPRAYVAAAAATGLAPAWRHP